MSLIISNDTPSPGAIKRALFNLPVLPSRFEVCAVVRGMPDRIYKDKRPDIRDYLAMCEDKGVMPFSTLPFRYDSKRRMFVPSNEPVVQVGDEDQVHFADIKTNGLLHGGKFWKIYASGKTPDGGYSQLSDAYRSAVSKGYEICQAKMVLKSDSGDMAGSLDTAWVKFDGGKLEARLEGLNKEESRKLISHFVSVSQERN